VRALVATCGFALVAATAACGFSIDYTGDGLKCGAGGLCPDGYVCQQPTNTCVTSLAPPTKNLGDACTVDGECVSGHCASGVCCDQACNGQCEMCSAQGTCGDCSASTNSKYCTVNGCLGVLQVAAGYDFTCSLMSDRSVFCWGANYDGQLGQGMNAMNMPDTDNRYRPVVVRGVADVTKLSTAVSFGGHVCALKQDKTVACWGSNFGGSAAGSPLGIGAGDSNPHTVPVPLRQNASTVFQNVNDIATGQEFTCLVDTTSSVRCTGLNQLGEMGDGQSGSGVDRGYPVLTGTAGEYGLVWSGYDHSCGTIGRAASTTMKCWGDNSGLGVGVASPTGAIATPTTAGGLTLKADVAQPIATGGNGVSCGISPTGTALNCWGYNARGQLGRGCNSAGTGGCTAIANTATFGLVCKSNGPSCTGVGQSLNLTTRFGIGEQAACAISNGTLYCWGSGNRGVIGDGTTNNSFYAKAVTLPLAPTQVAVGSFHVCAVLSDRTIRCWGWNGDGQIGNNVMTGGDVMMPTNVLF
jgi:alpha-tubulin suppressor-like RCC1 family protein